MLYGDKTKILNRRTELSPETGLDINMADVRRHRWQPDSYIGSACGAALGHLESVAAHGAAPQGRRS